MNWSDPGGEDGASEGTLLPLEDAEQASDQALYQGDSGELSLDTRRVLVQLLAGPSLDGQRHSRLWPIMIRDEAVICGRLSELFLQLVIDRDQQVAFTRQADTGDLEAPRLLRRANLTFLDSIVLLHLRQRLTQAEAHGDRAVVSTEEIVELLGVYEQVGNTDRALFEKRIHASIEKIKKHSILHKIRASENRFEISPTLKLLFSAEEIQVLTGIYKGMGAAEASTGQEEKMPSGENRE
ncbi:DUF4194 domain-containing protein [Magnetovirga frankeli]|uniref:DUF4194 domain-containing protein n=1 Tax=Magnetovirga frankeli TaxID=947516 RepID=UPI0012938501|nr:DUF4194 domain-containing protein [gamma proteobacterium SS-5]